MKITRDSILPLEEYARLRQSLRAEAMEHKRWSQTQAASPLAPQWACQHRLLLQLLVLLLRTIQEGPRQMGSVVQAPARDLVNLLKNYENKLAEAE